MGKAAGAACEASAPAFGASGESCEDRTLLMFADSDGRGGSMTWGKVTFRISRAHSSKCSTLFSRTPKSARTLICPSPVVVKFMPASLDPSLKKATHCTCRSSRRRSQVTKHSWFVPSPTPLAIQSPVEWSEYRVRLLSNLLTESQGPRLHVKARSMVRGRLPRFPA